MTENYAEARQTMVLSQLRPNLVTSDRIADAMGVVPREEFVPRALRGVAYLDEDLQVADDRFLIEPRVFGRMLQAAQICETDVVLDVACGTGYSSAVIGQLAQAVVAIDNDAALVEKATETLTAIEVDNVAVVEGALDAGNAKQGPYNVIHINGAIDQVPETLLEQLADGGRVICVLGVNPGVATIYAKNGEEVRAKALFNAAVPVLEDLKKEASFSF